MFDSLISDGLLPFKIREHFSKNAKSLIVVVDNDNAGELLSKQLKILLKDTLILTFSEFDCLPYDRVSPSQNILSKRLSTLLTLIDKEQQQKIVITTPKALLQKVPPKEVFINQHLYIELGANLPRQKIIDYLHDKGYSRTETVYEPGDYAIRGSLIDFFPTTFHDPIRLDFFGDDIESIRSFDVNEQKTKDELLEITLQPVSELLLTHNTIENFRRRYRLHANSETPFYQAISEGRSYPGMEHFLPFFFEELVSLTRYIPNSMLLLSEKAKQGIEKTFETLLEIYDERKNPSIGERPYYPVLVSEFFNTPGAIFSEPIASVDATDCFPAIGFDTAQRLPLLEILERIQKECEKNPIIICCQSKGSFDRLSQIFSEAEIFLEKTDILHPLSNICACIFPLKESFLYQNILYLSDTIFFGDASFRKKTQSSNTLDRFFKELNTYVIGDYLVHRDHGVGLYKGLLTLEVNHLKHDCIALEYADNNKLFLPVENMEVLSHFAKEGAANVHLDHLGSPSWQTKKEKVKKKIYEIADYILKAAAERELKEGSVLSHDSKDYDTFCSGFAYVETEDQNQAIDDVLQDLVSGKPMDRLVCGDVGFGKTEVAIRASFAALQSGVQVAIVVPTTLLARQHFENFSKRFKNFPYRIEMLSRLVSSKKATKIKEDLNKGQVHLVISTHAILGKSVSFSNLGLLIVDEEQHFGVKQKEKIKTLHPNVHILTLTATPIPRTLQMSLSNIRQMSLITTPPVDRIPVKTFVMEQDFTSIKEVITREHNRGGQVFYVSPRLEDLPVLHQKLKEILPNLRICIAHGQLSSSELESVIQDFYDHNYDVLLSTNIIESGIDIPTANTLVVHKANLFGLSQLYQIRGRIGRSKQQGYAYFTVPTDTSLSDAAVKRLKVLQSLDYLGAGFNLASHDLDIRGAGNIVGEEQSGHIREVGTELYQQMLQDAILNLQKEKNKNSPITNDWVPVLNLGLPVLIPEEYIADLSLRLGLYNRISLLKTRHDIDQFAAEIVDRFGPIPEEVQNLLSLIEIKTLCQKVGIEKIDAGPKGIVFQFHKNSFAKPDALLAYIQQTKGVLKIRPDQKLVLNVETQSPQKRIHLTKQICQVLDRMVGA